MTDGLTQTIDDSREPGASKPGASKPGASDARVARAFRTLRWRMVRNGVARKLDSARLRVALLVIFSLLFWLSLFVLFLEGFRFLNRYQMLHMALTQLLFSVYFVSLLVMLLFSTGIILYAALFASEEARFLLVRPIAPDQIFAYKFQEAMFFSSWGFLLLGSPMLLAYGIEGSAPAAFYLLGPLFFLTFAYIPGSVGALACVSIANLVPRRRREWFFGMAGFTLLALSAYGLRVWSSTSGPVLSRSWVFSLLRELRLSSLPFLPSDWISKGLLAATRVDGFATSLFYLAVLTSNALFLYLIAAVAYRRLYRRGYDLVHSNRFSRRRRTGALSPTLVERLLAPVPGRLRVVILKDIRTFLRDPVQWSQVLIFSGLLVIYVVTISRMNYYTQSAYWRNLIGFFNLAVTGLILSTYTSRFIFPLLSLEGQKFWILGPSPLSRSALLWSKFAFAAGGSLLVTLVLTLVGALVLRLEPYLILVQLVTVLILCFGISGISVGLGARFPEMRQTDPSKIAAGFGGTLNLVASLLFILLVIATMAAPCHLYSAALTAQGANPNFESGAFDLPSMSAPGFPFWLTISMGISAVLGTVATCVPMWIGIRSFEAREF